MFAISIDRLQWSTFEIGQSGSIGASDGEQMLPNCPCSLTGEHVVISAKWSCCANWQKLQLIVPALTDQERSIFHLAILRWGYIEKNSCAGKSGKAAYAASPGAVK